MEELCEPLSVFPLVPSVRVVEKDSLPIRREDSIDLVSEVATDAIHVGPVALFAQQSVKSRSVLRDLHRNPVDVVGEGHEGETTGNVGEEGDVVRRRGERHPLEFVEDATDVPEVLDAAAAQTLETLDCCHGLPGAENRTRETSPAGRPLPTVGTAPSLGCCAGIKRGRDIRV